MMMQGPCQCKMPCSREAQQRQARFRRPPVGSKWGCPPAQAPPASPECLGRLAQGGSARKLGHGAGDRSIWQRARVSGAEVRPPPTPASVHPHPLIKPSLQQPTTMQTVASTARVALPCSGSRAARRSFAGVPLAAQQQVRGGPDRPDRAPGGAQGAGLGALGLPPPLAAPSALSGACRRQLAPAAAIGHPDARPLHCQGCRRRRRARPRASSATALLTLSPLLPPSAAGGACPAAPGGACGAGRRGRRGCG